MAYGGTLPGRVLSNQMVLKVRVYLLTDALKRTETDGRRDITLLGDGRVLGPFSQKCQDSTFQTDTR